MPILVEHKKYVCSSALDNNNKFWEYKLWDDGTVSVIYGRIGKTSTEDPPKKMSRSQLDSKIRAKLKGKGKEGEPSYKAPYREITVLETASQNKVSDSIIREAAKNQLSKSNPELSHLVERLIQANKHELFRASGGKMDIDLKTGIISTPIGVVTKSTISEARTILNDISNFVLSKDFDNRAFISNLNSYLMLIPQTVGSTRGWHRSFFSDKNTLVNQSTLLNQLESSAEIAETRIISGDTEEAPSIPSLFNADLSMISDRVVIDKIHHMFMSSLNSLHTSRSLRPIKYYSVTLNDSVKAFDNYGAKLDNIWTLWHGTRIFNVLSILKNGLFCPPKSGSYNVTGRMFGDGIYASDQSTKALNYSYGFWDGGPKDKNCFMFLLDFAMGTWYTPKSSYETFPKAGCDSTFAKAGQSGVSNNEMIVYRNDQVNIKYLVEFEEK